MDKTGGRRRKVVPSLVELTGPRDHPELGQASWGVVASTEPLEVNLAGDTTSSPIPIVNGDYVPAEGDVVRIVRLGNRLAVAGRYIASG